MFITLCDHRVLASLYSRHPRLSVLIFAFNNKEGFVHCLFLQKGCLHSSAGRQKAVPCVTGFYTDLLRASSRPASTFLMSSMAWVSCCFLRNPSNRSHLKTTRSKHIIITACEAVLLTLKAVICRCCQGGQPSR